MSAHSYALGGFQGLARDPIRWFGSHLVVYVTAAVAAAAIFLAGAAVYSYVWGAVETEPTAPPLIRAPVMDPKSFPVPVPTGVESGDLIAGMAGGASVVRVGAIAFSAQDVTGVVVDNKAYLFSTAPSGEVEVYSVFVPYDWLGQPGSAAAATFEDRLGQGVHGVEFQTFPAPYPPNER